jgi:type III secretory pathway component EscT
MLGTVAMPTSGSVESALLLASLLALGRLAPLLLALPLVGWLGRLALLAAGCALLTPLLLPLATLRLAEVASGELWRLAPLLLHELGVGGLLLLGAALPLAGLRATGRLLASPAVTEPPLGATDPVELLLARFALALLFSIGGGPLLVSALARSYAAAPIPPVATALAGATVAGVLAVTAQLLVLSLVLALPLLAARLLAALAVSLLARSIGVVGSGLAPPLAPLVALLALVSGLAGLVTSWEVHLRALPRLFFR